MTETRKVRQNSTRSSEDSRNAILESARIELAENGWRKFSVDKVSRRAKASKQTIYRWWPAIGAMCVEAALDTIPAARATGRDPAERIADLLVPFEHAVHASSGYDILRGAVLASADDKAAGDVWRTWMKDHVRAPLRLILAEIASKKVIRRDYDLDTALDILTGPIWNRLVIMRAPLPDGFARAQAQLLLRMLAP